MRGGFRRQRQILTEVTAELLGNAKWMKASVLSTEPVSELQQVLVVDREQRTFQRREHRQLIVRPLDRRQRGANRLNLFAAVERLPADQQMWNASGFDGVRVPPRHVLAEADESSKENRDVSGLYRHALFWPIGLP